MATAADVLVIFYLQLSIPVSNIVSALGSEYGQQLLKQSTFTLKFIATIPPPTIYTPGGSEDSGLTAGQLAAITVSVTVVVILLVIIILIAQRVL